MCGHLLFPFIDDKKEIAKVEPEDINDWEVDYETYPGYARLISYKGDDTDLVIPNYINGYWVKAVGRNSKLPDGPGGTDSLWDKSICTLMEGAYKDFSQDTITSIEISEGIEIIEPCAFCLTSNLQTLKIPNTVNDIGAHAFSIIRIQGFPTSENKLMNVSLGKNIKKLGLEVFSGRDGINIDVEYSEDEIPSEWDKNWDRRINDANIQYGVTK